MDNDIFLDLGTKERIYYRRQIKKYNIFNLLVKIILVAIYRNSFMESSITKMKPKKCKNYDKEAGCIGCYGNGDDKCKGYNRECYDYEIKEKK